MVTRDAIHGGLSKRKVINLAAYASGLGTMGEFRLCGDSITSQNDVYNPPANPPTSTTSASLIKYMFYWNFAHAMMGTSTSNLSMADMAVLDRVGINSAFGGDSMVDMLANIRANGKYWSESYMPCTIGTNDIFSGFTFETLKANLLAIVAEMDKYNIIPIFATVMPRISTGWNPTDAAAKKALVVRYNRWLREYCREKGFYLLDFYSAIVDANGDAPTAWLQDTVHPNEIGSYYCALEVIRKIGHLFAKGRVGNKYDYDIYNVTTNPHGNVLNAAMTGTGGRFGTGCSGVLPDNFQISRQSGSANITVVCSVVNQSAAPLNNGVGKAMKIVISSTGIGASTETARLSYDTGASTVASSTSLNIANWVASGDEIGSTVEVFYEQGHNGVLRGVTPHITDATTLATSPASTTISFNAADNSINDSANGLGLIVAGRALKVVGSTLNNHYFMPLSVTAGKIICAPPTLTYPDVIQTESAATAGTVTVSTVLSVATIGASGSVIPDVTLPILYLPQITHLPIGGTTPVQWRMNITCDLTKTGTATIYIMNPRLWRLEDKPSVLNIVGHED